MKNIKQLIGIIGLMLVGMARMAFADGEVDSVFNLGKTGTTSATVVVLPGTSKANITDLQWTVDSNNTSSTVDIRVGKQRAILTSATSASGTALWFTNASPTLVNAQDYVIYQNNADGTLTLLKCTASAATSITVQETITQATTILDSIYTLNARVRRPAFATSLTGAAVDIWLPAGVPTALTLDGNTTACSISVSGVRSQFIR